MSVFDWNNGKPSAFATKEEAYKAKQHSLRLGLLLDGNGMPTVQLAPTPSKISISRDPGADAQKSRKISKASI